MSFILACWCLAHFVALLAFSLFHDKFLLIFSILLSSSAYKQVGQEVLISAGDSSTSDSGAPGAAPAATRSDSPSFCSKVKGSASIIVTVVATVLAIVALVVACIALAKASHTSSSSTAGGGGTVVPGYGIVLRPFLSLSFLIIVLFSGNEQ